MAKKEGKPSELIEAGFHLSPGDESDDNICFSDAEDKSWHSLYDSNRAGSSYDECRLSGASSHEINGVLDPCRKSCFSDCSVDIDLESGISEIKLNSNKLEKDCRICHLSLESAAPELGLPIALGCSCKDDLAAAHKQCAETWFKIKGNKICEICGSTACNVVGSGDTELITQSNETNATAAPAASPSERRSFWQGHRFLNFLLACMVFAFVIAWLFHFNAPG